MPSFHYDVAYLKSYQQYLPLCFEILDEALRLLDVHPEYVSLAEQVILLDEYWRSRPENQEKMRRFASEGRFAVALGQWAMPDLNHPGGEALFAQNRLGKARLEEHLGLDPKVCWIADCWGHPATLPQIMAQSGYEFYVFWRCMRPELQQSDFWWCGPMAWKLWLVSGNAVREKFASNAVAGKFAISYCDKAGSDGFKG